MGCRHRVRKDSSLRRSPGQGWRYTLHVQTVQTQGNVGGIVAPMILWLLGALAVIVIGLTAAVTTPTIALAALFGGALVVAIFLRPELGPLLLIPSVAFQSLRSFQLGPFPASSTELLIGVTSVAWFTHVAIGRQRSFAVAPMLPAMLLFIVGIVASFLSILAEPPQNSSLVWGFKELVKWAELLIVYVLAANLLTSHRLLQFAVGTIIVTGVLEALIGLAQFVLRKGPPSFLIHGVFMRAYGTFDQPNPFAGYLNMVIVLTVAVALVVTTPRLRRGAALAALIVGVAIVASLSRGAWLALGVTAVLIFDRGGPRTRTLLGFGMAFAAIVAWLFAVHLAPGALVEQLTRSFDIANVDVLHPTPTTFSTAQRLAFWIAGYHMFVDHWFLGVGMGNFGLQYPLYALPGWNVGLAHAHDYYINQAVETGVLGLAAYLTFLGVALRYLWRWTTRVVDPFLRAIVFGALGMLLTLSVHNFLDDLYVHGTVALIAILLAMAGSAAALDEKAPAASAITR